MYVNSYLQHNQTRFHVQNVHVHVYTYVHMYIVVCTYKHNEQTIQHHLFKHTCEHVFVYFTCTCIHMYTVHVYTFILCMCARVEWWCAYFTHACTYISKILTCLSSGVLNLNVVIDIHMKWVKGYYRGGTPIPSLTHPLRQCHPLPHSITSLLAPDMYMYAMKYGRVPKRHTCTSICLYMYYV